MKASRRARKSARAKKSTHGKTARQLLARVQKTPGAALVIVAAIVFIGAAAMMSARTPMPSPAPRSSARIDMAASPDMSSPDVTPIEAPVAAPRDRDTDGVTIVGCLTRDNEAFRLTDTAGDAAPRARSWKSGFLRKRSASLDLVGVPKALRLPAYVGQRVSVSGTLDDRELHVHSVRRVAASCAD